MSARPHRRGRSAERAPRPPRPPESGPAEAVHPDRSPPTARRERPVPPDILYHATNTRRLEKLLTRGTLDVRGGRPVYLSRTESQAWHVAHRQSDPPVVLYIDASRARREGTRFDRSAQGLWQATSIPVRHVLNLCEGFAEQVSAGGLPVCFGPEGPRLALIRVTRRNGSSWEVAKGKLEPGETPSEAAVREICEEMGARMELTVLQSLGAVRYGFTIPDGSPRLKTLHMYLLSTPTMEVDFRPAEGEGVREVGWFSPQEAATMVMHRSLKPLMRRICEQLLKCP